MRFLCLHGRGTTGQIFELQTAKLRQELPDHEFVFVDGIVVTGLDEGAESLAEEYYCYFDDNLATGQCQELMASLADFITSNGPFDGIMGFSEGGVVAAMLLIADAEQGFAGFRCGIFMSAVPPVDPISIYEDVLRCVNPATDGVLIKVPTAHMNGSKEPYEKLRERSPLKRLWDEAGMKDAEKLYECLFRLCDGEISERVVNELGHEVPGARSSEGLSGTLRAIRRTIERAEMA